MTKEEYEELSDYVHYKWEFLCGWIDEHIIGIVWIVLSPIVIFALFMACAALFHEIN